MKKFSPNAILALKEALTHIYWKKQDLRSNAVAALRNHAAGYFQLKEEKEKIEARWVITRISGICERIGVLI